MTELLWLPERTVDNCLYRYDADYERNELRNQMKIRRFVFQSWLCLVPIKVRNHAILRYPVISFSSFRQKLIVTKTRSQSLAAPLIPRQLSTIILPSTQYCPNYLWRTTENHQTGRYDVDCVWNVMAHAQKKEFVFRRKGRVHLNRRGRQFSRPLAAEVCASAVVMLDTPCSEVVWRVLATHSIRQFPIQFPSCASSCTVTFQLESTNMKSYNRTCVCVLLSPRQASCSKLFVSASHVT